MWERALFIHCTHGLNRTGYLIVSLLIEVRCFRLPSCSVHMIFIWHNSLHDISPMCAVNENSSALYKKKPMKIVLNHMKRDLYENSTEWNEERPIRMIWESICIWDRARLMPDHIWGVCVRVIRYEVATISRLLKIIGLFCRIQFGPSLWESHMRWLPSVGSIKLQVSFAKEPYKRDAIMQKRRIIVSILLIVATPYRDRALEDIMRVSITV